jgi:hypothetical protein
MTFWVMPEGFEIVAADFVGAAGDGLLFALARDDQGCGPGGRFIARIPPEFASVAFIKGDNETLSFMIPVDDHNVSGERGGCAFAEAQPGLHSPEVLFPLEIALHVVAINAARTEEGDDVSAVSDR